jgi:hypothetical protein
MGRSSRKKQFAKLPSRLALHPERDAIHALAQRLGVASNKVAASYQAVLHRNNREAFRLPSTINVLADLETLWTQHGFDVDSNGAKLPDGESQPPQISKKRQAEIERKLAQQKAQEQERLVSQGYAAYLRDTAEALMGEGVSWLNPAHVEGANPFAADFTAQASAQLAHMIPESWVVALVEPSRDPGPGMRKTLRDTALPTDWDELAKGCGWKGAFLAAVAQPERFGLPTDLSGRPTVAAAWAKKFRHWNEALAQDKEDARNATAEWKRQRVEEKAREQAQAQWEKSLISADDAARGLGLSRDMFETYADATGLEPGMRVAFRKWGKNLVANRYDPEVIQGLKEHATDWKTSRDTSLVTKRQNQRIKKANQAHHGLTTMGALATPEAFGVGKAPFPRRIIFHCGPTNSGKTYRCFEALRAAGTGVYAAPLRLLALEGWKALGGEDDLAHLITGEERRGPETARLTSCTIETLDVERTVDVAVLDEIQMLADPHRGWAWTQALLSVRARTVYLAGSIVALPWIKAVLARTGETFEIVYHDREKPLAIEHQTVHTPEPGDAIVTFSRRSAITLRNTFLSDGFTVALIYGGLPAEVREAEAQRFANGEAEVLVATDAIGMGLNLPIKRVLFAAFRKFDGIEERALHPEELRQIAGRAGRRGLAENGVVGAFDCHPPIDWMADSLVAPNAPKNKPRPWWRPMEDIAQEHWWRHLRKRAQALTNPLAPFRGAFDESLLARAEALSIAGFGLDEAITWMGAPAEPEDYTTWPCFVEAIRVRLGKAKSLALPAIPAHMTTTYDLEAFDAWTRRMGLLRWFDSHWKGRFLETSELDALWEEGTTLLAATLATETRFERPCNQCGHDLPDGHPYGICDTCHSTNRRWSRRHWDEDDDDDY